METNFYEDKKMLVFKITDEIDDCSVQKIRRRADYEIERYMPRKVVFDFDSVTFMDSAGIGLIIGRYKLATMLGGKVQVANMGQPVRKIFEMSGMQRIISETQKGTRSLLTEKKNRSIFQVLRRCNMNNTYDNEMKMEFLSKSNNEAFARISVAAFVAQLDPTLEEIADIKTAVSEAVTNSIIHGYEERQGIVKLICKIREKEVFIEISDSGKGIENVEIAKQPLYTTKANLERSGMGFTIMESFMDDVEVESVLGLGTKITMRRKIKSDSQKEEFAVATIRGEE